MSREATKRLLDMIEEGLLDKDAVINACVNYMSEHDVLDMCHANQFFYDEEEEETAEPSDEETCTCPHAAEEHDADVGCLVRVSETGTREYCPCEYRGPAEE